MAENSSLFHARPPYGIFHVPMHIQVPGMKFEVSLELGHMCDQFLELVTRVM